MVKSFIGAIFALLAATFGVHQATVATSLLPAAQISYARSAQVAAVAAIVPQTATSTTPHFQDSSTAATGVGTRSATNVPDTIAADGASANPSTATLQQPNTANLNSKLNALASVVGNIVSLLPGLQTSYQQQLAATSFPLGDGAPNTIAAASNISQLANVTVDGISGLTAGGIPSLPYLSSSGGTVSGLSSFTNASTSLLSVAGPAYFGTGASSIFNSAGWLGVGTTSPGSVFSVQGIGNWTTATSTYYSTGGINLSAGCFSINGTCITGGGGGGSGTVNAGTTGQVSFYAANGTALTATSTLLLTTSGNVGIGTTTPDQALDVYGYIDVPGNQTGGFKQGNQTVLNTFGTATVVGVGAGATLPSGDETDTAIGYRSQWLNPENTSENTSVGWDTLAFFTSGARDTAIGVNTMGAVTNATDTTMIGNDSMRNATTSVDNVGVGKDTLRNISGTLGQNVGIGAFALDGQENGSSYSVVNNVAIGFDSMNGGSTLSTADENVCVGSLTCEVMSTANNNVGVGYAALQNITTGTANTGVGLQALLNMTTGGSNVAFGQNAGAAATTSNDSTYIGTGAGSNDGETGGVFLGYNAGINIKAAAFPHSTQNTIIGANAVANAGNQSNAAFMTIVGYGAGTAINGQADGSTIFGQNAGSKLTSGTYNLILGPSVASNILTTGANNILIGTGGSVDTPTSGTNSYLNLGSSIFATNLGASSLTVGVGTTSPFARFSIAGAAGGTAPLFTISSSTSGFSTSTAFTVDQNGLVGIGTTTPGSLFSIAGIGNWTTATSTYYSTGGINLTAGCFSINGTCITGSGGGGSGTINTGTTGQVPFYAANGTAVSATSSLFISQSGNIGIGSTTPSTNLSIAGNGYFTGGLGIGVLNTIGNTLSFADPGNSTSTLITLAGRQLLNASSSATVGNMFFGLGAGSSITNGTQNTAFGYQALSSATSTPGYTAFGYEAAMNASQASGPGLSGAGITAIGRSAGMNDVGDTGNVYVGDQAGYSVTTGDEDVFIGRQAGENVTTGPSNTVVGLNSLTGVTTGSSNTAIGQDTLKFASTTSNSNVAVGQSAMKNAIGIINNNVAIGSDAMTNYVGGGGSGTADQNIAIGLNALAGNTNETSSTYAQNVAVGSQVGLNMTSGSYNVLLGLNDGINMTTASYNTLIGYKTGLSLTTGEGNILIGAGGQNQISSVDVPSGNVSNFLNIGNLLFGTNLNGGTNDSAGIGVPGGNAAFGTTTPYSRLEVWGPDTASTSAFTVVNNASTTEFAVYDTGNAVLSGGLTQNSDQRLKTNVQSLDASSSLAAINSLTPVSFNWINGIFGGGEQLGFIAQAVQQVFPQLISTTSPTALTPNGTLGLNYSGLIAPIIASIQGIAHISGDFQTNLIAWLGNSSNGIQNFFANNIYATNITTNQLTANTGHFSNQVCLGSTCITEAQLDAILAAVGQTGSAPSGEGSGGSGGQATSTPDTPPVISINGDNPAVVQVGTTYTDLGAIITGPSADLNLGITTYLNGTLTNPLIVDTSEPATDTIGYVATDQNGLTATSTRTVIIEAASSTSP